MSMAIALPTNQVRLTNVAVVRLTKGGKRFEVACYKNKIVDYRTGKEQNMDEVLQIDNVFTNVSKGILANKKDMKKIFGIDDETLIIQEILKSGQVQISEKERDAYYENVWREVANFVSEKCVNPSNNRRYTPDMIRQAMKMAEFSAHPTRSVKQQFLDCVKLLIAKGVLPIERAKMHLRIQVYASNDDVQLYNESIDYVKSIGAVVVKGEGTANEDNWRCIDLHLCPSHYRDVDQFCNKNDGKARLEVVQVCVIEEGDAGLEMDMSRRFVKEKQQSDAVGGADTGNEIGDVDDVTRRMKNELKVEGEEGSIYDDIPTSSRKNAKKDKKKSKKAKRREKEEEAERRERRQKELARQEERALRLIGEKESITSPQSSIMQVEASIAGIDENLSSCNTCGGSFTKTQYRAHFRSDWHRYNLKLKMAGAPAVSEEEFKLSDIDFL
mmetsp:Transcript_5433/g.7986  ORF Transcript_5433/g.7986 Transcript_5433/m.7986 type:complete len:442 (-) Transcript_5433:254-1579(-)